MAGVEFEAEVEQIPPSVERVKLRLMVLWANGGRGYLEGMLATDRAPAEDHIAGLKEWVFRELSSELTEQEAARHRLPVGAWTPKQRVDYSWDMEANATVCWALGLVNEFPKWDEEVDELEIELFDFPSASTWRSDLSLRPLAEIEEQAKSVEAKYWRIRTPEPGAVASPYCKKLMGRAAKLGQVKLAVDGDLALSDGRSVASASEDELQHLRSIQTERLAGLNWLCGHDPNWDMITADTIVGWLWDTEWPDEIDPGSEPAPPNP